MVSAAIGVVPAAFNVEVVVVVRVVSDSLVVFCGVVVYSIDPDAIAGSGRPTTIGFEGEMGVSVFCDDVVFSVGGFGVVDEVLFADGAVSVEGSAVSGGAIGEVEGAAFIVVDGASTAGSSDAAASCGVSIVVSAAIDLAAIVFGAV